MTKKLPTWKLAANRKERKTKPCITRGCTNKGTRRGLCRSCYYWYPYDCYIAGCEPTASRLRSDGYVDIQVEDLWCLEHRAIIMRELGRRLERNEMIRHKDGNRSNNERSNLRFAEPADFAVGMFHNG